MNRGETEEMEILAADKRNCEAIIQSQAALIRKLGEALRKVEPAIRFGATGEEVDCYNPCLAAYNEWLEEQK